MDILKTNIESLKGVGPQRAAILQKELGIFTFRDLLHHFPFRYEDKTKVYTISELNSEMSNIQIKGKLTSLNTTGSMHQMRLQGQFRDETGVVDLVWFKGLPFVSKNLVIGREYVLFGKPTVFNGRINFTHPELSLLADQAPVQTGLSPVYHTTEVMKKRYLESKNISQMMKDLFHQIGGSITETLPDYILQRYGFISRFDALKHIHFPITDIDLKKAESRLKFEELFFLQLKLLAERGAIREKSQGWVLNQLGTLKQFYNDILPFDLTNAQKKVIKEIREDVISGKQMNRLLQGDVGSGKTMVAFITMLMAVDNSCQACIMAPTEILAEQHYQGLSEYCEKLGISIQLLTGSTKKKNRIGIHEGLQSGELKLLVGTHALLEDTVQFYNLGMCIIDEQHRFGVAQRARLWAKNPVKSPHILVMTATPIPRTLAMTVYGDLDVSIIDELPAGRKPIETKHYYSGGVLTVQNLIKRELAKGHQAYIVYPLIEESEKMDLKNLMEGYHHTVDAFPGYFVSIVHGKLTPEEKESEMKRFIKKETQIMVATTVIEVGVNVPNATIMVIENAERFGLSQLHQLRGRVGRGGNQSYCILVTGDKVSKETKIRMETLVRTTDGFEIADVDLKLRGPGDMSGTQQSGIPDLKLANLSMDGAILKAARDIAAIIVDKDPKLQHPANALLREYMRGLKNSKIDWATIS